MHQEQYDKLTKLQKSMLPGSMHDYLIRITRFIFPMIITSLLTFLILSPLTISDELSFVLDKDKVDIAPERLKVTDALYRGKDSKDRPFSLKARSAIQKSSDIPVLDMESFVGRIIMDSGPAILTGHSGSYNLDSEIVKVIGPLDYKSQGGHSLTASNVTIDLRSKDFESFNRVSGKTDFGSFNANKLSGNLANRNIILSGNVNGTTKFGSYRADSARGDLEKRTIILEGNTRLTFNR